MDTLVENQSSISASVRKKCDKEVGPVKEQRLFFYRLHYLPIVAWILNMSWSAHVIRHPEKSVFMVTYKEHVKNLGWNFDLSLALIPR